MNRTIKLVVLGGILAAGVVQSQGQNIVQNININLTGVAQGDQAVPVRISNKDLLGVLGGVLGSDFTGGKLLLISTGEGSAVIIRTRGAEDVDVSEFISKTQISDGVVTDRSTETKTDITTVSINQFVVDSGEEAGTSFDVQGYTTERTRNVVLSGETIGESTDTKATVAGTGTVAGQFSVLQGSISVTGRKIENTGG